MSSVVQTECPLFRSLFSVLLYLFINLALTIFLFENKYNRLYTLYQIHVVLIRSFRTHFRIPYPPTREIYVFNRYGQHIATKDLTSGKTRYSFLYSKNTSFGKLSTVADASGNKILFRRDYSNVVSTIENTQDHKSDLKISGVGFLVKFSEKGESEIELEYDSATGLLTSRADSRGGGVRSIILICRNRSFGILYYDHFYVSLGNNVIINVLSYTKGGETFIYRYGENGRLSDVVLPTGETVNLASRLTPDYGLAVQVAVPLQSLSIPNEDTGTTLKMEGRGAKRLLLREGKFPGKNYSYKNIIY